MKPSKRKWPYWIPDPFNLAALGVVFFAVVGFLFVVLW